MKPKFKLGDRVKVIKYGSLGWFIDCVWDFQPELVGKKGIIQKVELKTCYITPRYEYSIEGIPGKSSWYDESQLIHASWIKRLLRFFW